MTEPARLAPGQSQIQALGEIDAGQTYRLTVAIREPSPLDRASVELRLRGPGGIDTRKLLHAGDPDLVVTIRSREPGACVLESINRGPTTVALQTNWQSLNLDPVDSAAIEAEPNDNWRSANSLTLERAVYGLADDVDYLENKSEGTSGLDWFRIEFESESPKLAYIWLDILDRDISCNLRFYRLVGDRIEPFDQGKDPNEVVHDREPERYSKHLSRVLTKGVYFVEVNANHPDYILRSRLLDPPPYAEPAPAIDAAAQYLMQSGDAWFNQIPREGNIYARTASLHDTATRCTACHPAAFPTEATLAAHSAGYPIRAKSSYQYVIDRIYNSPAPLYGDQGLYFQRFIAIPLQAQGKQGAILLDHERQIAGPTPFAERFAPFLAAAWAERDQLPADEQNGVVPLDSKFGIAWRDWRVLSQLGNRARRDDWTAAANKIAALVTDPAADKKVETLQDRIHRVRAWSLINQSQMKTRIDIEIEAFWKLQNADGGWHELDSKPGPSAVYTTGQMVWTLVSAGASRDDPRLQKAAAFLLSQQQPFGGWIQTTTHENFRTPMRETRFAIMALAALHPNSDRPPHGIGNRDGGPAHAPNPNAGIVSLLDDLENLWDVPPDQRESLEQSTIPLLSHPDPVIRAATAASLGRWAQSHSAAQALRDRFDDPSKTVWRSAAWAYRRLANQGIGRETLLNALDHPNPAVRRGATRALAYHTFGLDDQPEFALRLIGLTADADLWTRLQAIKSLRHWFYRTADPLLKRRIVSAHLAGLARDEHPAVRRNLVEGLYIIMDENLGGGVSLQKTLAQLPQPMRDRALADRAHIEEQVLLRPILGALESADARQRSGILQAFDGSFFKGRFYARRPTGMIDVGNDREFGFLHEPELSLLERAFKTVFQADLSPVDRLNALKLAHFFDLPDRTRDPFLVQELRPETLRNAGIVLATDKRPAAAPEPANPTRSAPASLPSFETFRDRINPLFYQPSADGVSCAKCHGTHEILRLAPPPQKGSLGDDEIRLNYQSALKVIDLVNPSKSLLIRKPRSPHGQGDEDPSSPTGITHVGGPRWEGNDRLFADTIMRWIGGESLELKP
jgi:HEAT repeat protein